MLLGLLHKDKVLEHKLLGKVSCEGYASSYHECQERQRGALSKCNDLYDIAKKCYKSENPEELVEWLDEQFRERKRLVDFLAERKSTLLKPIEDLGTLNVFGAMGEHVEDMTWEQRYRRDQEELRKIKEATVKSLQQQARDL